MREIDYKKLYKKCYTYQFYCKSPQSGRRCLGYRVPGSVDEKVMCLYCPLFEHDKESGT